MAAIEGKHQNPAELMELLANLSSSNARVHSTTTPLRRWHHLRVNLGSDPQTAAKPSGSASDPKAGTVETEVWIDRRSRIRRIQLKQASERFAPPMYRIELFHFGVGLDLPAPAPVP